jgi:hypothetical protein
MRRIAAYVILLVLPVIMSAEERHTSARRMTFGAEWGYVMTFFSGYHNNFFSPDGWRVDDSHSSLCHFSNAEINFHVGYDFSDKWNLSAYAGFTAIQDTDNCIPVSLRATRYFTPDMKGDRWFSFIDLGSGISVKKHPQEILTGKIGAGYRILLSERTRLDFLASLRMNYTHADIIFDNIEIQHDKINRNNVYGCALSVGISLSF